MSSKFMKSAAVLGTVTLASLLLVACGSKTADKPADSGSSEAKEITLYVEDQYKAFAESAAKAYEKEAGVKVTIKTGDQMGGLDNLSLDNQSGKAADVMMAPYDRVGSLGTDGQLSEVKLSDGAKTDDKTKSLVTAADGKVNYGVATIPTLPNGKEYAAFGGGKAWIIPSSTKNLEAAQKFVDFLVSTEEQKAFYDTTNEIPANTEARSYAEGKNDELTTAVIKQFKNAQPMPNISQMSAVWDPAKTMLFEAVSGKKDAKTAANDAVTLIKETIKQKFGE